MDNPKVKIVFTCDNCGKQHTEHTTIRWEEIEVPYPEGWSYSDTDDGYTKSWLCKRCYQKWLKQHPDVMPMA